MDTPLNDDAMGKAARHIFQRIDELAGEIAEYTLPGINAVSFDPELQKRLLKIALRDGMALMLQEVKKTNATTHLPTNESNEKTILPGPDHSSAP